MKADVRHLIGTSLSVCCINFGTIVGEDKIHQWYETDSGLDAIGLWRGGRDCAELVVDNS